MSGNDTMEHALKPTPDPAWVLVAEGYDPLRESSTESRFTISNGFLGVRGTRAITRGRRWVVPPHTHVAGLFDVQGTEQPLSALVPVADWLQVSVAVRGSALVHHPDDAMMHCLTLDMRRGAVLTECRLEAPATRLDLRTLRLVSLHEPALGLQLIQLKAEEGEAEITLEASFEGLNLGLVSERLEQDLGVWRTRRSGKGLAIAAVCALRIDGADVEPTILGPFRWSWTWTSRPGQVAQLERLVAMARSDIPGLDPAREAQDKRRIGRQLGWRGVLAEHVAAWTSRWQRSEVIIDGNAADQLALRFAAYHLNSAASPADELVSIGARGLTGDDYLGHVFWDTEIFLLPFYIFTWPAAARALLMYRFHTLDGARAKAASMGWRGALFAWESTDTGAEATPEQVIGPDRQVLDVLCGKQEQHISADVAYAVWQYWQATRDEAFLLDAGAEILLETGRFWSSRAQLGVDGLHHIRGVIGPDEYHENVSDNAFTNVMARWNIRRALDVAALLQQRWPGQWAPLSDRLGLDDAELAAWLDVAETMATGLHRDTGLFEQFAGYFDLEEIDLATYAGRSVPMDVVLGRQRTQGSQVIKQADVVALLALLPGEFAGDTAAGNFGFYEPRCGHGSSLSRVMHGLAAARLGYPDKALGYFRQAAAIDLSDTHVAIAGGIHIAALGGIWQMAVLGFAGLSLQDDALAVDPKLPADWNGLGFHVQWRQRHLKIRIEPSQHLLEATLEAGHDMTLVVCGNRHELCHGQVLRVFTEPVHGAKAP